MQAFLRILGLRAPHSVRDYHYAALYFVISRPTWHESPVYTALAYLATSVDRKARELYLADLCMGRDQETELDSLQDLEQLAAESLGPEPSETLLRQVAEVDRRPPISSGRLSDSFAEVLQLIRRSKPWPATCRQKPSRDSALNVLRTPKPSFRQPS